MGVGVTTASVTTAVGTIGGATTYNAEVTQGSETIASSPVADMTGESDLLDDAEVAMGLVSIASTSTTSAAPFVFLFASFALFISRSFSSSLRRLSCIIILKSLVYFFISRPLFSPSFIFIPSSFIRCSATIYAHLFLIFSCVSGINPLSTQQGVKGYPSFTFSTTFFANRQTPM